MKVTNLLFGVLFFAAVETNAQVGIGTLAPVASAMLEVQSTTKGMLVPKMTAAQRTAIGSPVEGLLVYQNEAPLGFYYFTSGAWVRIGNTNDDSAPTGTSMYAGNTAGGIVAVILGGTPVPVGNVQNLSNFVANGASTLFTVPATGRYRISYKINLTAGLLAGARVVVNGVEVPGTGTSPVLTLSQFDGDVITTLTAGSTIGIQLYGVIAVATLQAGQGASLTVVRVQ